MGQAWARNAGRALVLVACFDLESRMLCIANKGLGHAFLGHRVSGTNNDCTELVGPDSPRYLDLDLVDEVSSTFSHCLVNTAHRTRHPNPPLCRNLPYASTPTPSVSSPLCAVRSSQRYTTTCSSATRHRSLPLSRPSLRIPSNTSFVVSLHLATQNYRQAHIPIHALALVLPMKWPSLEVALACKCCHDGVWLTKSR